MKATVVLRLLQAKGSFTHQEIDSRIAANRNPSWYFIKHLRLIAGVSNATDEKYYDRVFADGIEPAPRRSGYAGLPLAF